jgi:hypothetical protein
MSFVDIVSCWLNSAENTCSFSVGQSEQGLLRFLRQSVFTEELEPAFAFQEMQGQLVFSVIDEDLLCIEVLQDMQYREHSSLHVVRLLNRVTKAIECSESGSPEVEIAPISDEPLVDPPPLQQPDLALKEAHTLGKKKTVYWATDDKVTRRQGEEKIRLYALGIIRFPALLALSMGKSSCATASGPSLQRMRTSPVSLNHFNLC